MGIQGGTSQVGQVADKPKGRPASLRPVSLSRSAKYGEYGVLLKSPATIFGRAGSAATIRSASLRNWVSRCCAWPGLEGDVKCTA